MVLLTVAVLFFFVHGDGGREGGKEGVEIFCFLHNIFSDGFDCTPLGLG